MCVKISNMDFVTIDLEKLGDSQLSICEVGMVKYQNGKYVDEFHSYIQPPTENMNRNRFGKTVMIWCALAKKMVLPLWLAM